jgi:uncharacterized protein YjbI with pentapeptide repeats
MATWAGGGRGRDANLRPRARGEVFPALGVFIGAGLLAGAMATVGAAGLLGRLDARWPAPAGLGAGLGAILGLFVGLGRGVWRPGMPIRLREPGPPAAPGPAAPPQLWDPWVDSGRDVEPAAPEATADEPESAAAPDAPTIGRAAVRPRVISPETGEAIRLDDEIGAMIEDGRGRLVILKGGPGSGKTTALRHLAAVLPPWARGRIRLLEEMDLTAIASVGPDPVVILALDTLQLTSPGDVVLSVPARDEIEWLRLASPGLVHSVFHLAPWDRDDAIEYLLASHRDACASVMSRSGDLAILDGIPELGSVVLDRLACDEAIGDVREALRRELAERIESDPARSWRDRLAEALRTDAPEPLDASLARIAGACELGLARLIRHRPAAVLLAADRIATIVEDGRPEPVLAHHYPRELVREVARRIADKPVAIEHLDVWIRGPKTLERPLAGHIKRATQALAASLLHTVRPGWRPDPDARPWLEGAYLDGVVWPKWELPGGALSRAEFRHADLSGANLECANARRACFRGANLQKANLRRWSAIEADLGGADLSRVLAQNASLLRADLSGAILVEATLWKARLTGARIDGADFTGASLEEACLRSLALRLARFDGARFGGADLRDCDMEDMALTDPDFHDADLRGADLTGSRMPGAKCLGADLRDARLAEIDWPGACLRDADLRGANFHLGTTRSGMLDSPIACEGSRTGFYTDDFLDREVKPAEEIRKANLRGADLRGADIRDVDFYLVDLREARYSREQAEHLRRCRAILDDRRA